MFRTEHPTNDNQQPDQLPTIYVVDGDKVSRDFVSTISNEIQAECKAFETAEQYLQQAVVSRPGCLVLELKLSGIGAMELQQTINQIPVPIPVVIHTAHAEVSTAVRSMENGAVAFIEKPCDPLRLTQSIQQAIDFDREQLVYHQRLNKLRLVEQGLVDRERRVIKGMIIGQLNKSIARDLDVSVRTIENVRSGLLQKFKANNSAELVSKYTELLLLSDLANRIKPARNPMPRPHFNRGRVDAS